MSELDSVLGQDILDHSIEGFITAVILSDYLTILVEGPTDERLFEHLLMSLSDNDEVLWNEIAIQTMETLPSPVGSKLSNRDKVIYICSQITGDINAEKIVGFVDREFSEFREVEPYEDLIKTHKIDGRLVWSLGHSIENYFFDTAILKDAMAFVTSPRVVKSSLQLFVAIFDQALQIACALGLAGRDVGRLGVIARSLDWHHFRISAGCVSVDETAWRRTLVDRTHVTEEDADRLCAAFSAWRQRLEDADRDLLRWWSHGHIGLEVLWAVYARCVLEVSGSRELADKALASGAARLQLTMQSWCARVATNDAEAPLAALAMLNCTRLQSALTVVGLSPAS